MGGDRAPHPALSPFHPAALGLGLLHPHCHSGSRPTPPPAPLWVQVLSTSPHCSTSRSALPPLLLWAQPHSTPLPLWIWPCSTLPPHTALGLAPVYLPPTPATLGLALLYPHRPIALDLTLLYSPPHHSRSSPALPASPPLQVWPCSTPTLPLWNKTKLLSVKIKQLRAD